MRSVRSGLLASTLVSRNTPNTTEIPLPLVVQPSQYWDGVDGSWSSFALRIGTPAQNVRVLASTNSDETFVVVPDGCSTHAWGYTPIPSDCASSRGSTYNSSLSSTYHEIGTYGINGNGVGFEASLGYSLNTEVGLDDIGLGYAGNGPTLNKQNIAAFGANSPFYLGLFGLGTQPVNFTTVGNSSTSTYFASLRSQNLIPGLSWSYTAGAKYRLKNGQYAQLIFGGYDQSRFTSNSAEFTLNDDINRDIVVAIQSITSSGTTQATFLSAPIYAFIESTDPNIWLPEAACQQFENSFGLTIDSATGLYLINDTHLSDLTAANAQVTFTIANSLTGGQSVNINFPIQAFLQPTKAPFTPNNTHYFPLRKAANDSQYTLGRAFLQEAYLTVDYDRGNFSVSQCLWNDGAPQQLGSILAPSYTTNSSNPSNKSSNPTSSSQTSPAVIAIAVVIPIILIMALLTALFLYLRQRKQKRAGSQVPSADIVLDPLNPSPYKDKFDSALTSPAFPAPAYSKDSPEPPRTPELMTLSSRPGTAATANVPSRSMDQARAELNSSGHEIHQLPTGDNRPLPSLPAEVPGSLAIYELPSQHVAEMDDSSIRGAEPSELDGEERRDMLRQMDHHPPLPFPFHEASDTYQSQPGISPNPSALSPHVGTMGSAAVSPRMPSPMSDFSPMSPFSDFYRTGSTRFAQGQIPADSMRDGERHVAELSATTMSSGWGDHMTLRSPAPLNVPGRSDAARGQQRHELRGLGIEESREEGFF